MSQSVRLVLSGDLLERYDRYAQITNKTIKEAAKEALEDWMDTVGEGDIEVITGVQMNPDPLPPLEFHSSPTPMISIYDLPTLAGIRPVGKC
jgi:hypothetical protein